MTPSACAALLAVLLLLTAASAVPAASALPAAGPGGDEGAAGSPNAPGRGGSVGVFAALGSVSGARLGLRYFPCSAFGLEADGGYVRVSLLEEDERTVYTDGWSASLGGSWYILPDAVVSPTVSLTATFMQSAVLPRGNRQTRLALLPAIGSEYFIAEGFSVFFRFGPAFQLTDDFEENRFETLTQFDIGLAFVF